MQTFKHVIFLILLFIPGSTSCVSGARNSSVKEFNCLKMKQGKIVPGTPGIKMVASSCKDYIFKEEKLYQALAVFVEGYSEEFGVSIPKTWELLRDLKIEVGIIPKVVSAAFDINGKPVKDVPVSGLALSKDWIWVEINTKNIWPTSLSHELIHAIIWRQQVAHGDPDHEGSQFSGWSEKHTKFIKKINRVMFDLDL